MGCNHRYARHWIGNVLRNVATTLTLTAERIDPQPKIDWPTFTIHGDGSNLTGTWTSSGPMKWHRTG